MGRFPANLSARIFHLVFTDNDLDGLDAARTVRPSMGTGTGCGYGVWVRSIGAGYGYGVWVQGTGTGYSFYFL